MRRCGKVLFGYVAVVTAFMLAGLAGAFAVGRVITKPIEQATAGRQGAGRRQNGHVSSRRWSAKPMQWGRRWSNPRGLDDQAEQQIMLLMREVNHRSKNMLAVVQAIARQMIGSDPQSFVKRFSDRIVGLAASQDLLIESNWQGVRVGDLVRSQLSLFRELIGTRILIDGPLVRFTPAAAQAVGMALHELATNASKYGALSDEHGSVHVSWSFDPSKEGEELTMSWVEEGGRRSQSRSGAASGTPSWWRWWKSLSTARWTLAYPPTGLSWTIVAPARCTYDAQDDDRGGERARLIFALPSAAPKAEGGDLMTIGARWAARSCL